MKIKAPYKRTQHFWMLHVGSVAHLVACCYMSLGMKTTDPTTPNIVGRPFARSYKCNRNMLTYQCIQGPDCSNFHKSGISLFCGHEERIDSYTYIELYHQRNNCFQTWKPLYRNWAHQEWRIFALKKKNKKERRKRHDNILRNVSKLYFL